MNIKGSEMSLAEILAKYKAMSTPFQKELLEGSALSGKE
jgi:hypothetical protein